MQKNQCTAIEKLAAKKTDHHKDTDMIAMVKDQVASLKTIYFPIDFFIDSVILVLSFRPEEAALGTMQVLEGNL